MVEAMSVTAGYGGGIVLHNVGVKVDPGAVCALVGRNASGKSTLLKVIMGVLPVTRGRVRFFGQDVTQRTTKERIEQGIGYMPQGGVLFPDLTIQENVQAYLGSHYNYDAMFDQLYHWPVSNAIKSGQLLRRMAALLGRHRTKARSLSGGEKQLVSIARTLLRPSRIILLDEPSIGLAPALLRELGTLLQDLAAARGTGMIIVDQNVPWVLGVSRYAYILQQGTVKAEGSSSEFLQNPEKLYAAFGLNAGSQ